MLLCVVTICLMLLVVVNLPYLLLLFTTCCYPLFFFCIVRLIADQLTCLIFVGTCLLAVVKCCHLLFCVLVSVDDHSIVVGDLSIVVDDHPIVHSTVVR